MGDTEDRIVNFTPRLPQPGDCATCDFPNFMHEEDGLMAGCVFVLPSDELRKKRLLAIREAR